MQQRKSRRSESPTFVLAHYLDYVTALTCIVRQATACLLHRKQTTSSLSLYDARAFIFKALK
jgi:hypothetical protein